MIANARVSDRVKITLKLLSIAADKRFGRQTASTATRLALVRMYALRAYAVMLSR